MVLLRFNPVGDEDGSSRPEQCSEKDSRPEQHEARSEGGLLPSCWSSEVPCEQ